MNIHFLPQSKPIRLSDDPIFMVEEGTEFHQLFAGTYCIGRPGENVLFYSLKLLMFRKNALSPYLCHSFGGFLRDYTASHCTNMRTAMSCCLILYIWLRIGSGLGCRELSGEPVLWLRP
jgi:hypothetical protein